MVYPEETDTWEKKKKNKHAFFDCWMKFLNYFPFKTTSHLYLF